ncbi:chemotaxis protein CheX [Magnetococcus sp. PR-3]|uniref:chemotaxis protein CheX n=1 Tax=Magnetococcus sp. PR-3 TaxID=3120355 RepID=UPI002FCDF46C
MDKEILISALQATVTEVMGTMAWAEVGFAGQEHSNSLTLNQEVGGLIRLRGESEEGLVGIACNKRIASELVSRIVGLPAEELLPEDLIDGVAELANMICGGMKTKAEMKQLELSPPVAIVGSDYTAEWKTIGGAEVLTFLLEGENFQVHLSL